MWQRIDRVVLLFLTPPLPCIKQVDKNVWRINIKRCSHWKHQLYKLVIYTSFALKITQFYYHRSENPVDNNSTFLNISLVCDFTVNNGECSYLFKEVHDSATICQALFAYFITPISVPTNLLLIASMHGYRSIIDDSTILFISFLISNTVVFIFLNGEIFFTPLILAWWVGYWGCKVVTFIIICGLFARWFTVAFISFDRFRRIFFALIYPRHSKKVHDRSYGGLLGILTSHCRDYASVGRACRRHTVVVVCVCVIL